MEKMGEYLGKKQGINMNFFDSVEHLEPRCHGCGSVIDWGTSTRFDEEAESHICLFCGSKL